MAFGQDGKKGRLVVDGLRAQEGSLPGNFTISLRAPVSLGSSPSGKPKVNSYASETDKNKALYNIIAIII